jgi:hypothetical protein
MHHHRHHRPHSSLRRSEAIVVPLASNTPTDMESNVARVVAWVGAYKVQHGLQG